MQPHPGAERAQLTREIEEFRAHPAVAEPAFGIAQIDAVGRRILRDHQQFLDARLHQPLGLRQDFAGRPRHEIAAQFRDDAKRAAVVAALRNLQIGVMARREFHALGRHEIEERIMGRRNRGVNRRDDAFIGLRPGDGEKARIGIPDLAGLGPHAAGDDDLAVFLQSRADRRERFRLGAVEKAAGIDDDGVGAGMALGQLIALGPELRDDALAVDERLRAPERDEGNFRRGATCHRRRLPWAGCGCKPRTGRACPNATFTIILRTLDGAGRSRQSGGASGAPPPRSSSCMSTGSICAIGSNMPCSVVRQACFRRFQSRLPPALSGKMWRLVAPPLRRHQRALAHLQARLSRKDGGRTRADRPRHVGKSRPHLRRSLSSAGIRRKRADHPRGRGLLARQDRPHQGGRRLRRTSGQLGTRRDRSPAAKPQADRRLSEDHQSLCRPAYPGDAAGLLSRRPAARNRRRRRSSSCAMHAPAGPSPSSPTCAKGTA